MPSANRKPKVQHLAQSEIELFAYEDFETLSASRKKNRARSTSHVNLKRRMGFLL